MDKKVCDLKENNMEKVPNIITEQDIKMEGQKFYCKYPIYKDKAMIRLHTVDSIYEKAIMIASTDGMKKLLNSNQEKLSEYNGTVIWGKTINDYFDVFIATKIFRYDLYTWRGTIFHEFIHAFDFYDYTAYLNIKYMDEIMETKYYSDFCMWSEFHARRIGYKNVLEYVYRDLSQFNNNIYLSNIKLAAENYCTNINLYNFMQFAGRYFIIKRALRDKCPSFQDLFQNKELIVDISEMEELYNFLEKHDNFNLIIDELELLRKHIEIFNLYSSNV